MNWYSCAEKMIKTAEKAHNKHRQLIEMSNDLNVSAYTTEEVFEKELEFQKKRHDYIYDVAIDLMNSFTKKRNNLIQNNGEKWYFITVRPPPVTEWETFKNDWEKYIKKNSIHWEDWTYVWEQKGETENDLGQGFHVHLRIKVEKINYYPSHIRRDLNKIFNYVAEQCKKIEFIKSLERCIEYMQGDKKSPLKEQACKMDIIWRNKLGLPAEVKKEVSAVQNSITIIET